MDFDFKYVSSACPELTDGEVRVLLDELRNDARYDSATVPVVRDLANRLFPGILREEKVVHFDGRERIQTALKYLNYAYRVLDTIPERVLTDGTGMVMIDINSSIHYLGEEIDKLEKKSNES